MKALSLIFKGVDKGALKTTDKLGSSIDKFNTGLGKSPGFLAKINTAIGAVSLSKISGISDKMSDLTSNITGAGQGASEQVYSWKQLQSRMKAAGEDSGKISGTFGVINEMTRTTNKSFDEMSGIFNAFRENSADIGMAADSFKRFGKFVAASGADANEFGDALSTLSYAFEANSKEAKDSIDRTVATARAWGIADKSAEIFSKSMDSVSKVYNQLTGDFKITPKLMADVGQQTANLAGMMRTLNYQIDPQAAVGMTDAFFKMRLEMQNMQAGEIPQWFEQLAVGVGMSVPRMQELVKTDPQTFYTELMKGIQGNSKSILKNKYLMGLLTENMGLNENATYMMVEGLSKGNLTLNDFTKNLVSSKDAMGAMANYANSSGLGVMQFGERLKKTTEATSRNIMSRMSGDLDKAGVKIAVALKDIGDNFGKTISDPKRGITGDIMRFGFLVKEQGIGAAVADIAQKMGLLGDKSSIFGKLVFAMQGIDPTQMFAMVTAVASLASAFPALLIGIPIIYTLMKAFSKAGLTFEDFIKKPEEAFRKLFDALTVILPELIQKATSFLSILFASMSSWLTSNQKMLSDALTKVLGAVFALLKSAMPLIQVLASSLTSMILQVLPMIAPIITEVGKALGKGLLGGVVDSLKFWKKDKSVPEMIQSGLGGVMKGGLATAGGIVSGGNPAAIAAGYAGGALLEDSAKQWGDLIGSGMYKTFGQDPAQQKLITAGGQPMTVSDFKVWSESQAQQKKESAAGDAFLSQIASTNKGISDLIGTIKSGKQEITVRIIADKGYIAKQERRDLRVASALP